MDARAVASGSENEVVPHQQVEQHAAVVPRRLQSRRETADELETHPATQRGVAFEDHHGELMKQISCHVQTHVLYIAQFVC